MSQIKEKELVLSARCYICLRPNRPEDSAAFTCKKKKMLIHASCAEAYCKPILLPNSKAIPQPERSE